MRIFNNVEMLELKTILANGPGIINPLIVWDEKDVVLFDAGLPGMGTIFRETAADTGVPFERLNKILITHSDMDHIGSLSQIIHEAGLGITLMVHKEERPYIECELPPVRVKQMEASVGSTTGAVPPPYPHGILRFGASQGPDCLRRLFRCRDHRPVPGRGGWEGLRPGGGPRGCGGCQAERCIKQNRKC